MTRPSASLALALLVACRSAPGHTGTPAERARALAQEVVIVDGHIDVPYRLLARRRSGAEVPDVGEAAPDGEFDWPRARAGGLDAPFFSIFTPASDEDAGRSKAEADGLIDLVEDLVRRHPERFRIARTANEVLDAKDDGRIALLLGMENGSPIENDLANLEHFWRRGVRYVTLCHGSDNPICDSSYDTRHTSGGLTAFGRRVVERMNELGVLVDISHVSDDSFWQVLAVTRTPVIASHSSLRAFVPGFERDISDRMLRALAANGGVAMINFGSTFLRADANAHGEVRRAAIEDFRATRGLERGSTEMRDFAQAWDQAHPFPFATVADVADHIDHAVAVAGIDHVGLGSDFDGVGDSLPVGLKDVSMYPNLIEELLRRGYTDGQIAKICGGNALRVMRANEAWAREHGGR
jgi:membrane dipeptidase